MDIFASRTGHWIIIKEHYKEFRLGTFIFSELQRVCNLLRNNEITYLDVHSNMCIGKMKFLISRTTPLFMQQKWRLAKREWYFFKFWLRFYLGTLWNLTPFIHMWREITSDVSIWIHFKNLLINEIILTFPKIQNKKHIFSWWVFFCCCCFVNDDY